ncbi:MAG TPA: discoidin domain-containing protein [Thermoanaerobaculia bacterium]
MSFRRPLIAFAFVAAVAQGALASITSTSLRIEGSGLRIVNPAVTTGIDLPVTVQTEFGGKQNDEAVSIEGVVVVGDLTGPEINTPIQLTTAPGYKFQIPGLSRQGVYYLQNIRMMKGGEFLQYATPSIATITVADLLETKVKVRQLSPEELRARGITVDARNFDVYEYTFTFTIDGQEVVIPFPVIIDSRTREVQPVAGERPYVLPKTGLIEPPRWTPPQIIPMEFGEEGSLPVPGRDPISGQPTVSRPKIPAAIVIPNSFAVLHQFFAVSLMVTNGAPDGSTARLEDLRATIKIPTALRTVKTLPTVAFGQPVPIVEPETGVTFLIAQARGEAEWTLEGLQPGTHRIDFELRATLRETGQVDVPLRATPSAAIVVHDPRFNLNFSHPATVRKDGAYSTYAFITNMSAVDQHITVTSGVQPCDVAPGANVCRLNGGVSDLLSIPPYDMRIIEYRLRAGTTGRVFATAGTISGNLNASVQLHMGVSESGIPLSPATLILPHYAQFIQPEVVSANLQLLGLGYSLATAPVNQMTAKFPRVIRTDVFTRAVDIARAGQRIFITDDDPGETRDSISHLALDLLGNAGYELREWDQLRRGETSGRIAGASIARELERTGLVGSATMQGFVDSFAAATAHRNGYLLALAHGPATGDRPFAVSLTGRTTGRRADVPNEASTGWVRDLPFSDLSRFNGGGEQGEIAFAGRWSEDLDVVVTPASTGSFALELIYPGVADGVLRRARFEINGQAGERITVTLTRGADALNALFTNGGIAAVGAITTVEPSALLIAGARQDLHLDEAGHKVSVLFNRPVAIPDGVDAATRFSGAIDFNRDGIVYSGPRPIFAAALQEDGRTVNLSFDHALSVNAGYSITTDSLIDPTTSLQVSFPAVAPTIDNDSPAGVLYGHVLKGDNSPIAGADVVLRQFTPRDSFEARGTPQFDTTRSDGAFLFEYVRREPAANWSGAYLLEALSTAHGKTSLEGSVRLPGRVHIVSLQYLGRGAAEGYVRYDDGSVVAGASIVIGSTMFDQFRRTVTDSGGFYRVDDLPVGPLTFSAKDASGNVAYAAGEIATAGQLVTKNLSIYRQPFPGTGRVRGVVRRADTNAAVPGARVGVYSQGYGLTDAYTDAEGRFDFESIPAGFVTLLAAEWSISRESAVDFDLKADELKQIDIILSVVSAQQELVTLTGQVLREKSLQPGAYEPVSGALVKIDNLRIVTADVEGRFVYDDVPLSFSGKGITAYDPATQRAKKVVVPTLSGSAANTMSIFINASDTGRGKIRVNVLSASGQPVTAYRVIVPGFPVTTLSEIAAGVYELPDVPVGTTHVIWAVPSSPRPEGDVADPRPHGDQYAKGTVKVSFNDQIAALTLRLPGQGTVRVRVRSQFDLVSPVTLSYLEWNEAEQSVGTKTRTRSTEVNGVADHAIFTNVPALSGYSVSSAHPQYGHASAKGVVGYHGDLRDHTLQLNTLSTVRGTVYAIDGVTPVQGATVTIANGSSNPGPRITGADGRFEFLDQPSGVKVTVTAQLTQSDVYRAGFSTASTPSGGGVIENMAVILRRRGSVEGHVVYKDYKVYDPQNPANNVPDDTPTDLTDNAPVKLARFYLRELDFPHRNFGTSTSPLTSDIAGQFILSNVFVGALRATAWDSGNQELRGDWTGSLTEESGIAVAWIAVGGGGVGSLSVSVVDPNENYIEVPNADVTLFRSGKAFDTTTTGPTGVAELHELPVGTYVVSAYSKSLGKSSKNETVTITRDLTSSARLELEFTGRVDGTLTDPQVDGTQTDPPDGDRPIPGALVRLTASSYLTQSTTDIDGFFLFDGVREGQFTLSAKDTMTNRRALATRELTVLDWHRTVALQLEPVFPLHLSVYLPDDTGGNSGVLAPPANVEVTQRCSISLGVRSCDYQRLLQGSSLQFPGAFEGSPFEIKISEIGGQQRNATIDGTYPQGTASSPVAYVWPAYGDVHVTVTQADGPASGAKVTVSGGGRSVNVYTDSAGLAVAQGFRLGGVSIQAQSFDGRFSGTASATIQRQSIPATATIALGTYAGVTGLVEAEGGGPSVGTRVIATFSGIASEVRTDGSGRYTFIGIPVPPTGSTTVQLTFVGPDDSTVGGGLAKIVTSADTLATVATVRLDATPPRLESIVPLDGSTSVSPDSSVIITFSETIKASTITTTNFKWFAADGSGSVAFTFATASLADGRFVVRMIPAAQPSGFPLRSNTLYRVLVEGNVTDLTGHRLPGTLGFSFTTSDYAEPRVMQVLPASPIPRATTFEFRFNEPIDATSWQTGGNGVFQLLELVSPGGPGAAIERALTGSAFVDPQTQMSLFIAPDDANPIEAESYYRVTFSGVRDLQGNVLGAQTFHYFSFDETPPHVVFMAPASSEELVSAAEYQIAVDLRNGNGGSIATDVKKVDYFIVAADGSEMLLTTVTAAPFGTKVLAPDAPPGGATFTLGAQATDLSGNQGPKTTATWTVKPNAAPQNVVVTPVASSAYPSREASVLVTFEDEGTYVTVTTVFSTPRSGGSTETKSYTKAFTRTAGGAWTEARFAHTLPVDAEAGALVTVTATVQDIRTLVSEPATATILIESDENPPEIISVTPPAGTTYFDKNTFTIEAIVSDAESGIQSVAFQVDGAAVASQTPVAGPSPGTLKYRSALVTVRSKAEDAQIPIVLTARDNAGNAKTKAHEILYKGVHDSNAPLVTWLCPIDGGAIPANAVNFPLELRVKAIDADIRSVTFHIGDTVIESEPPAESVYSATYTFTTPAEGQVTIIAIVKDTVEEHTVELPVTLDVIPVDFTFTDPKAITVAEAPSFNGKSIALIGTNAVLVPQAPLSLANLLVLNGARVETLPTSLTREFRLDITTSGVAYVDCGSRIDVTEKGYLGGRGSASEETNIDVRGLTLGNTPTGGADDASSGSYAGLGGSNGSGKNTNAPYGSITQPEDLGSGGGGAPTCCRFGGAGGGAVALRGTTSVDDPSRILIAGQVLANGGSGIGSTRWAAGSGGSIWLDAKQIVLGPSALVSVNGGDDDGSNVGSWGAGGGRIAIAATERLVVHPGSFEARGGRNTGGSEVRTALDGGAGTIHVRRPGQERGELTVSSNDTRFDSTLHLTRPTPLSESNGTLTFDRITVGARALVRFDDTVVVGEIADDKSSMTVDPSAAVVLHDETVDLTIDTTPAEGANLILDSTLGVTYSVTAAAGVGAVSLDWSPETTPRLTAFTSYPLTTTSTSVTLPVPASTVPGEATLGIRVTDRSERFYDLPVRTWTIVENAPPIIESFTIAPGLAIHAGRDVVATVVSSDDLAVKSVAFEAQIDGVVVKTSTVTPNASSATTQFTVPVPPETAGGSVVTISVAVSDGFAGRAPSTATQTVAIVTDDAPPSVNVTSPAAGTTYRESIDKIPVRVIATDAEVAVKEVLAQLDSDSDSGTAVALERVTGTNEWRADITAPPVDGGQDIAMALTITAKDYAANSTTSQAISVTIRPVIDENAPKLSWACSSPGAMYPPGWTVTLRVNAVPAIPPPGQPTAPVESVTMTLVGDDTPLTVASIGNNQYQATFAIPSNAADDTLYRVRVIAKSAGDATSDLITSFTAAIPTVAPITANTTIGSATTTYENQTVLIQGGTVTVSGAHTFDRLMVLGGSITTPSLEVLNVTTTRGMAVACGGVVDVTGRGFGNGATYLGASPAGSGVGGSHLGRGGAASGEPTFGSVYRPQEAGGGAGGGSAGGGVVKVTARTVVVDGVIRSNSGSSSGGTGAGGSVWITTDRISGGGTIEASGTNVPIVCCPTAGGGGGGAISINYTDPTSTLPVLRALGASGRTSHGAAGTIYTSGPHSTYGDLTIDDGSAPRNATRLPSLGKGVAELGTSDSTLMTDRSSNVPGYFVGHWVEITDAAGSLKGRWRVATVPENGKVVTLEHGDGENINLVPGDRWQGIYLFDTLALRGARLESSDPVRTQTEKIVGGTVEHEQIATTNLLVTGNSLLTHIAGARLTIDVEDEVRIDAGSAIDVTGRGFGSGTTYLGASAAGAGVGGSHIGRGGAASGEATFGSVYRPQEAGGGGGGTGSAGGGVVKVTARTVVIDGVIRSNSGASSNSTGAGGSVWIKTDRISGGGTIEAKGTNVSIQCCPTAGGGGGGAISINYTDPTSTLPVLRAGPATGRTTHGGAGSVYVLGPQAVHGEVQIDSTGINGRETVLPSLGRGRVESSDGTLITTDRTVAFAPYFAGHWIDIFSPEGVLRGTWRIESISGTSLTLALNAGESAINVQVGDDWRGVYLFDKLTLGNAKLLLLDDLRATIDKDSPSTITINDAPAFPHDKRDQIVAESRPDGFFVVGPAGAVADLHAPIVLTATNNRTSTTFTANAAADGSFRITVQGIPGDTFHLYATDSFAGLQARSITIGVNGELGSTSAVAFVGLQPAQVTGGTSVLGTVRLVYPALHPTTVVLSSSSPHASVPASVTIPAASSSAEFVVSTTSVSANTVSTISASYEATSASASLTLLAGESVLTQLALDASSVEGGASLNATVTLGAPAPPGGAVVVLGSSDTRLADVPDVIVVPEGTTTAVFTVRTRGVVVASEVSIRATYGATHAASVTLSPCAELGFVPQPDGIDLGQTWVDDALPSGATPLVGSAELDASRSALGSLAIHLSGSESGVRLFGFTGGTAMSVGPNDRLVVYALVNPCNPPRQILLGWKAGSAEYRASWGEGRIEVTTPHRNMGTIPVGGEWVRLEVLARSLGITSAVSITDLSIRALDGEVWFDAIGTRACAIGPAAAPEFNPNEIVWFDDELPAGAVGSVAGGITSAWSWDEGQAASGVRSHVETLRSGFHEHSFTNASDIVPVGRADVLFTYVYLDPCNPPRMVMLQWHDGTSWSHRAYWGDDLSSWGTNGAADRYRVGPLPELGKWVRLEVPALPVNMVNQNLRGMSLGIYDGQAWFDRAGRIPRVNVAKGKSATQSSLYQNNQANAAANTVDGDFLSFATTESNAQAWWQVDLGASYPIEMIWIYNRADCCSDRLSNFWVLLSDQPIASTNLTTARMQPGVVALRHNGQAMFPLGSNQFGASVGFAVHRTARYVRVQLEGTNFLHMREVEVWAPATVARANLAIGGTATQSSNASTAVEARQALDGLVGTNYQSTNSQAEAWWQADLGSVQSISSVMLNKRADTGPERLANFYLFVSDEPFASTTVTSTLAQQDVSAFYYATVPSASQLPVDRKGRYVRVQLTGTNFLHLSEVQVWGQQPTLMPLSRPITSHSIVEEPEEPAAPEVPVSGVTPPDRP